MNERRVANGARWRQIADVLSREVASGYFGDGRLPTEPELAERFAVNRHTIRRAVGTLVEQGLLTVTQGRGTFVAEPQIDYVLGRRTRFRANLQREGRRGHHRMLASSHAVADAAMARDLGVAVGTALIQVETLGVTDDVGLSYSTHSFLAARFERLPDAFAESGSITAALAVCGVDDYTRRVSRIIARMPSEEEASHLGQPTTRPVLQVEAVNVDLEGVPIERATTVFAGDRVQMIVSAEDHEA